MIFSSQFRSAGSLPTALLAVLSAFVYAPTGVKAADNLETVLAGHANLTTFRELIKDYPNIFTKLPSSVTVIVPNDNAFDRLGNWHELKTNKTHIDALLRYHILPKPITMSSIVKGESIWSSTLLTDPAFSTVKNGQRLILTKQPGGEVVFTSGFANRGTVVVENLEFDKGLIQVVDAVMRVPENLEQTARNAYTDLTAFLGALFASDLMGEVIAKHTDLTIFAPHNSAFQHLSTNLQDMSPDALKRLLKYHVVPGTLAHVWELKNDSSLATADGDNKVHITRHHNSIFVNAAQIVQTDILIANGLVHMIDNVLDPNQNTTRPDVDQISQSPVIKATGTNTLTGTGVPTPFTSHLPCTASCPVTETVTNTLLGGAGSSSPTGTRNNELRPSSSNGGVAGARCTGLTVAAGAGAAGLAVGALLVGL